MAGATLQALHLVVYFKGHQAMSHVMLLAGQTPWHLDGAQNEVCRRFFFTCAWPTLDAQSSANHLGWLLAIHEISAPLCGQDGPHRGHKRNRREQNEGPARWFLLRFGLLSPLPRTEYFGFPQGLWRNKPGPDYTFCAIQNKLQTEQTCCLQSLGIFVKNFRNNNGVLQIRLGPDNFSPASVLDWSPSWANFFSNFLLDAFAMFSVSCRTGQGWRSLSQISEHFRLPRTSTQTGFWLTFWSKSWPLQTKPGPDNFWPDLCWIEVLLWLFFAIFSASLCILQQPPLRWYTKTRKPCKNARSPLSRLNAPLDPSAGSNSTNQFLIDIFAKNFPSKNGALRNNSPSQLKLYCLQVDLVSPELLLIMPRTFGVGQLIYHINWFDRFGPSIVIWQ